MQERQDAASQTPRRPAAADAAALAAALRGNALLASALASLDAELNAIVAAEAAHQRQLEEEMQLAVAALEAQQLAGGEAPAARRRPAAAFPRPPECAFLRPGTTFEGQQRVAAYHGPTPKAEFWEVAATIEVGMGRAGESRGRRLARLVPTHPPTPSSPAPLLQHYDLASGRIAGTMRASNVPDADVPVTTYFEGEVRAGGGERARGTRVAGACRPRAQCQHTPAHLHTIITHRSLTTPTTRSTAARGTRARAPPAPATGPSSRRSSRWPPRSPPTAAAAPVSPFLPPCLLACLPARQPREAPRAQAAAGPPCSRPPIQRADGARRAPSPPAAALASQPYVFMRWNEQFFVEGGECRLTIAGFYAVCLDR